MVTTLLEVTCKGTLTPAASDELATLIRSFLEQECYKEAITVTYAVLLRAADERRHK